MFDIDRILAIPDESVDYLQCGISGGERAALEKRGFIRTDGTKAKDYMIRTIQKTAKNKAKAEKAIIKGDKPIPQIEDKPNTEKTSIPKGKEGDVISRQIKDALKLLEEERTKRSGEIKPDTGKIRSPIPIYEDDLKKQLSEVDKIKLNGEKKKLELKGVNGETVLKVDATVYPNGVAIHKIPDGRYQFTHAPTGLSLSRKYESQKQAEKALKLLTKYNVDLSAKDLNPYKSNYDKIEVERFNNLLTLLGGSSR